MDNPTADTVMNKRTGPSHKSSGTDDKANCSKILLFLIAKSQVIHSGKEGKAIPWENKPYTGKTPE